MARIVIIVGHPRENTLCDGMADSYAGGASGRGHHVEILRLAGLKFDPILHTGFESVQPLEPDLVKARQAIGMADHLVILFPLWLGDMPAILKGFLERIFQPELIGSSREGLFLKLLSGKTARIITTMGMPGLVYRICFGAAAVKILRKNILNFIGVKQVSTLILGNVMKVGEKGRERWLDKCEKLGQAAA